MYSLFENILTSAAGTAYPSGAPEFTPGFKWGCVGQSLYIVFGVVLCTSLFVLFLLGIVCPSIYGLGSVSFCKL